MPQPLSVAGAEVPLADIVFVHQLVTHGHVAQAHVCTTAKAGS